ncbi:hypothetical protein BCR36DRAFT_272354 [Piromyces finnis]|uniref:Uncharacterized protein n=1 Tax=Piromyces finnis TaxID=1754191 RepID=A0A1Y1VPE6_9FUNG|nr:hypothetical protein BCR36DRAFT_272354 [Piromyces finnis]|eukprot:ORX60741.1 hypothetical protein BCR36DRAFT_272354 [Piromyces finnis]
MANIEPEVTLVNNINHEYESNSIEVNENELAMIQAEAGKPMAEARLLLDTCSNLNVVSKDFLDNLESYEKVGYTKSRIRQAAMDYDSNENLIVKLPIRIRTFNTTLRVIDHQDAFYDILIGLKALADHKLIVIPHKTALVRELKDGTYEQLAILNKGIKEEKLLCILERDTSNKEGAGNSVSTTCMIKNEDETITIDNNDDLTSIEGLPPKEYIHHNKFISNLDPKYSSEILKILDDHMEAIATSSDELTPSLLPPHEIKLKPGTHSIKQRSYRLSKIKANILKEELTKLINKNLIEPSKSGLHLWY